MYLGLSWPEISGKRGHKHNAMPDLSNDPYSPHAVMIKGLDNDQEGVD